MSIVYLEYEKNNELPGDPIKHSQVLYHQQLVCPKDEKTIGYSYATSIDFQGKIVFLQCLFYLTFFHQNN